MRRCPAGWEEKVRVESPCGGDTMHLVTWEDKYDLRARCATHSRCISWIFVFEHSRQQCGYTQKKREKHLTINYLFILFYIVNKKGFARIHFSRYLRCMYGPEPPGFCSMAYSDVCAVSAQLPPKYGGQSDSQLQYYFIYNNVKLVINGQSCPRPTAKHWCYRLLFRSKCSTCSCLRINLENLRILIIIVFVWCTRCECVMTLLIVFYVVLCGSNPCFLSCYHVSSGILKKSHCSYFRGYEHSWRQEGTSNHQKKTRGKKREK